jgi:hypothetical protein
MGEIGSHRPVLLIVAAFSRYAEALAWARARVEAAWGPIALASGTFAFQETEYYAATMGTGLVKRFWAVNTHFDPSRLAPAKHQTNAWESEYAGISGHAERRPLNLDPGYLTEAKLVLASTKDHAHRIYLHDGIYAEVTLHFQHGAWRAWPWTFPDYRREEYHEFFMQCRRLLRQSRAEERR